jgi:uncharacterized protein YbaR (Trm112 family)
MRRAIIENKHLSGFPDEGPLKLEVYTEENGHVSEGVLIGSRETWYPVIDGVPRLLRGGMRPEWSEFADRHNLPRADSHEENDNRDVAGQSKTTETFSDKWRRFQDYGMEASHQAFLFDWYCKKLGMNSVTELESFYGSKRRILEVGPGSGFNSRYMAEHSKGEVFAVDLTVIRAL